MLITLDLPFPPSSLSGHHNEHWRKLQPIKKKWRQLAHDAVWDAVTETEIPESGDIGLHIHFVPPDRRGDRLNYVNRCKPIADGIADALGINDRRFLPSISYAEPEKPGRLVISIDLR
jgi:hypothetical protein